MCRANEACVPCPHSQVQALPTYEYEPPAAASSSDAATDGKTECLECAVCLGEFDAGESVKKLPCDHVFHQVGCSPLQPVTTEAAV